MLSIDLKNMNTLVIGGARGIGAAVAQIAAAAGSNVAWTHLDTEPDRNASEAMLRALAPYKVKVSHKAVDCASQQDTSAFIDEFEREFGAVDNLVYCAGFTSPAAFLDITCEEWQKVIDINLSGAFIAAREAIPSMLKKGKGNIVIIGSAAIVAGGGGRADYVSAKAGLEGLNRAITKEFAPRGIRCNLVHPSLIDTDLLKQRHPDAAKRAELGNAVPLRRLGQPEDIGNMAVFLLSDLASYITGQAIFVDGGRTFCK